MSLAEASRRTKLLYGIFVAAFAIGLALILALILALFVGFTGVWLDAQVPRITVLIVYVALALVVLRLALAWSMGADRR